MSESWSCISLCVTTVRQSGEMALQLRDTQCQLQESFPFQFIPPQFFHTMSFASIFGGALAYGLFFYFANNKEITGFSTLAFLTPIFALLSGGVYLNERLTIIQWIGVVFVLISVFFVSQRKSIWEFSNTKTNI